MLSMFQYYQYYECNTLVELMMLAAIAALYVTMFVGRSDGRSVSTSFKDSSNTLKRVGRLCKVYRIHKTQCIKYNA